MTIKSTKPSSPVVAKPAARPDPESLQVVHYPDPVLQKRAKDITTFDPWLQDVIRKMKHLMVDQNGVGLAAPQVGLSLRLFVFSEEGTMQAARALINPVFSLERGQVEGEEGCLSLPDIRTKVVRFQSLHVEALDESGKPVSLDLADFPARIVQHENDHLEGILLLDRMSPMAKIANRKKIQALQNP